MISKEKEILMESFDRRSLKSDNTKSLMDSMFKSKQNHLRNRRKEEYLNQVEGFKKQGETYDIKKLGYSQERRMMEWEKELEDIQTWLDK